MVQILPIFDQITDEIAFIHIPRLFVTPPPMGGTCPSHAKISTGNPGLHARA